MFALPLACKPTHKPVIQPLMFICHISYIRLRKMDIERCRILITALSVILMGAGILTVLATNSNPYIELIPGDKIEVNTDMTFRIHLWLTTGGSPPDSPLNPYLINVVLPDPLHPTFPIRIRDPDGVIHNWVGGNLQVSGGPPGVMSKYIDVVYGPGHAGWSPAATTATPGTYYVDFAGRFYTTKDDFGIGGSRSFDVLWKPAFPEIPMSAALFLSGLVLLFYKSRLAKLNRENRRQYQVKAL